MTAALIVEQPAHPGLLERRGDQVEPSPGVAVRGRGHRHPVEQMRADHLVFTCTLSADRKNPPCANSVAVTASARGCSSPSASNARSRLA